MDSLHARLVDRPRLRAKEFVGGASTRRTISMLQRSHIHEPRPPPSPSSYEILQNTETGDHSKEGALPSLHNPSNIRLITVLPELKEGLPQCLISVHSIDESFTTLSYTWGNPIVSHTIWLNQVKFGVRCHLWQFLFAAAHNFPNVLLWIDALCIDQLNINERNEQVTRMSNIYTASNNTLTFLAGTECASNDKGLGNSAQVYKLRDLDPDIQECLNALKARKKTNDEDDRLHSLKDEAFDDSSLLPVLRIIASIICNAYWARLWVIQENILSATANTIIHNDTTVSFSKFSSLVTYICKKYRDDMLRQFGSERHILDRATAGLDKSQPPSSEGILRRINDNASSTIDEWIVEILECTRDPTRIGLITADFLPLNVSGSPELQRYEFLQLLQRVQTSLCSDRRDKIYGLRAFQKSSDRFSIDYHEDIYGLYFTACRYFDEIIQKEQEPSADGQTVTIQAVSAGLDLGILDLIFGDDLARTVLATTIQKESILEGITNPRFISPYIHAGLRNDSFLLCEHCRRHVTLRKNEGFGKVKRCVVQCHRQLHVSEEIKDDHHVVSIEEARNVCCVEVATSWVSPNAHTGSAGSFAVNDRARYSLDQILWLVLLDETFRHRSSHAREIPLADPGFAKLERTSNSFTKRPGPRSYPQDSFNQGRITHRSLEKDDLKGLGLEGKAEMRMLQCLNIQLSLRQNTRAEEAITKLLQLFDPTTHGFHQGDRVSYEGWHADIKPDNKPASTIVLYHETTNIHTISQDVERTYNTPFNTKWTSSHFVRSKFEQDWERRIYKDLLSLLAYSTMVFQQ